MSGELDNPCPGKVDRLEAVGVTVRPNGASTGRFNGFAFEFDGIPFKGLQPGCQSASNSAPCGTEGQLGSRVVVARNGTGQPLKPEGGSGPTGFERLACLD